MTTILNKNYYDTKDLSEMLGLTRTTIRRFIRTGALGSTKIGTSYYVTEDDILRFLGPCKGKNRETLDKVLEESGTTLEDLERMTK